MMGFDDALRKILTGTQPLETTRVSLREALGQVAAEQILAGADVVSFPRSAMDGYAIRSGECANAAREHPVILPVVGEVFAERASSTLMPGTALAIATGAPLPEGADAVIPHEEVECTGSGIHVTSPVAHGACIFSPGEDLRRGDEIVACGETLRAATLALLAFAGTTQLNVFRRPRAAVVCNGHELVDPAMTPGHGQVRNSNALMLTSLISELGGLPDDRGTAPDDTAVLSRMLKSAHDNSDLLITTGGASAGTRDLIKGVLKDSGAQFLFEQVAMRPGKPFGFALWDNKPVCVLPGTPAAAFVCFQELVRPAMARLTGKKETSLPRVRARLKGTLRARSERRYFVLARLELDAGAFVAVPLQNQCSALVRTAADSNAIIVVPETHSKTDSHMVAGDMVDVDIFDWPRNYCVHEP